MRDKQILSGTLSKKKWQYKKNIYAPVFEEVSFLRPVSCPGISCIVIAWRDVPDLERNLNALRHQDQDNLEIVFVDNGASPGVFESILPFIDVYVRLNRNTGAYLARNLGALFASAPILFFLDDDAVPHEDLIAAHLYAHREYNVTSVQGAVLPKTNNPLNAVPVCYYLGDKPFPVFSDIEGNTSYNAVVFFDVGGWDDAIVFGGGGVDLALRILNKENDPKRQMYFPYAVIYHDHARDMEHKKKKFAKQIKSRKYLRRKHPAWDEQLTRWLPYYGREDQLPVKRSATTLPPSFVKRDLFMEIFEKELVALSRGKDRHHYHHVVFFLENMLRIGNKFLRMGRFEESERWFQKVLRHRGRHITDFRGRAYCYLGDLVEQQTPGSGATYWEKALFSLRSKTGKTTMDVYHIASLYKRLGNRNSAKRWFRRLLTEPGADDMKAGVYFHLGEIDYIEGDHVKAAGGFEKCLAFNPHHKKAKEILDKIAIDRYDKQ